ncbi:MAG: class II fumarate hydratase [Candidatus Caldipriscus sp.]|nr:class II fumarate hydratase [Candidatus Caldipriscus sp.]
MADFRIEKDTMGEVKVPAWAYWGAQTQRAIENFPISGWRIPKKMIYAIAMIKRYAAEVNAELGLLDPKIADAIIRAAEEVMEGKFDEHFPIDVFQTGSATSTNMNVNEVIANRANEILGSPLGSKHPVHPNDHVNKGQSSNDVIPSAIHIALRLSAEDLIKSLEYLEGAFRKKEEEFKDVIKIGRTHLQDAVPMTLGQEFSAFATQIKHSITRIKNTFYHLEELALGGTAVGTGLNTHKEFAPRVISKISKRTGIPFREAENKFEALATKDAVVEYMGALNTLAVSLMKIGNDIRLLSSGPRTAIAEIILPSLQPGSSIMPGKVNPVIPEMMIQVAAHIMGAHLIVSIGGQHAPLQLNVMQPLIAYHSITSTDILTNALKVFADKCVIGIEANRKRCEELVEWSMALVTPLALKIGYDRAAEISYKAYKENKTVRQVVVEEGILTEEEAREILDPKKMLGPYG